MIVERLCDHRNTIPTLVNWFVSQWGPYYGHGGPGDARADLEARCNRDTLPIGLVALDDGQVLGTATLDRDVTTGLAPSIVGLLVGPNHRRRGVATQLLKASETLARDLGERRLHVSTAVLGGLLGRTGWRKIDDVVFLNGERGAVYVRDLQDRGGV